MKPSATLEADRELIRRIDTMHRGSNPRVFGAVVRGDDTDGSERNEGIGAIYFVCIASRAPNGGKR